MFTYITEIPMHLDMLTVLLLPMLRQLQHPEGYCAR